jgi:serine/threonine-protein kinase
MSPEQLLAQRVDARSDLWSVAALVYRIVTGDLPFGSGTLQEMSVRIVTLDPRRPSEIVPTLPPAFDAWIAKGLAKSADDRFQSAQELADALMEVAGSQEMPFALHPSPPPDSGMRLADLEPITKREARPALERTESGVRRVRSPLRALSVLVLLVVGSLVATAAIPSASKKSSAGDAMSALAPEVSSAPPPAPAPSPSPSPSPSPEPPKRLKSKHKFK